MLEQLYMHIEREFSWYKIIGAAVIMNPCYNLWELCIDPAHTNTRDSDRQGPKTQNPKVRQTQNPKAPNTQVYL